MGLFKKLKKKIKLSYTFFCVDKLYLKNDAILFVYFSFGVYISATIGPIVNQNVIS